MSTLLDQVLKANIYVQPVLFILIVVTNSLSIRILCSRTLRHCPCSYYFVGYAISNIICSCLLCPTQIIRGVLIGWENTSIGCYIYFYALYLPPIVARLMLVLASFDRYCSSSKSRRLHSTNTKRTVRINIIITTISAVVYMSPMSMIFYFDRITGICRQYTTSIVDIYVFSQIILYYGLAPLLLIIFGILTIINIRQRVIRMIPQNNLIHNRRTDGQLARMLLLQVFAHIILTTPFGIIYSLNAFNPSSRTPYIIAIRYIFLIFTQCDFFMSFFLYISSASIYREQLRQLFRFTR